MKTSYSLRFYIRNHPRLKESSKIYARITVDRKKSEFYTQKVIETKQWDHYREEVKSNHQVNRYLLHLRKKVDAAYEELTMNDKHVTSKSLKMVLEGGGTNFEIISYIEQEIERLKTLKYQYSSATITIYATMLKHLTSFLATSNYTGLTIQHVNLQLIEKFESYLLSDKEMKPNSASKYLKKLNTILNRAVRLEHIKKNPFESHTFKTNKTMRVYLTLDEVEKLESLKWLPDHLERTRDVFLFMVYTGLRFSDIKTLMVNNIEIDADGNKWLSIVMRKTNDTLRVPLLAKAINLLEKYKVHQEITSHCMPVISNQKLNAQLKEIGKRANITKSLSAHSGRHTFATSIRVKYGIPIEVIKQLLGHSKISTTMIYAKIVDEELLRYIKNEI